MGRRLTVAATRDLMAPNGAFAFGNAQIALLRESAFVRFIEEDSASLTPALLGDADALLHLGSNRVTRELLEARPGLALIARLGVGCDQIDLEACTDSGTIVSITPRAVVNPMAMGAAAMMLSLSHGLVGKDRLVRAGMWSQRFESIPPGLFGKTLGIIGLGRIGRAVVSATGGFGLSYLASGPRLTPERAAEVGASAVPLGELLARSDVVCVCCPLTSETRDLISATELAMLRETAILVNVSRGGIVNEEALAYALNRGRIAGAGIDVFANEPPTEDSPLLTAPNVVLAPHSVGYTTDMLNGLMQEAVEAIRAVASGAPPHDVANPRVLSRLGLTRAHNHPAPQPSKAEE